MQFGHLLTCSLHNSGKIKLSVPLALGISVVCYIGFNRKLNVYNALLVLITE